MWVVYGPMVMAAGGVKRLAMPVPRCCGRWRPGRGVLGSAGPRSTGTSGPTADQLQWIFEILSYLIFVYHIIQGRVFPKG